MFLTLFFQAHYHQDLAAGHASMLKLLSVFNSFWDWMLKEVIPKAQMCSGADKAGESGKRDIFNEDKMKNLECGA